MGKSLAADCRHRTPAGFRKLRYASEAKMKFLHRSNERDRQALETLLEN
jgi:hypothetical protein